MILVCSQDAGDNSVPRKVISNGANLANTDPFWKERKCELDSLHVWRKYELGDLAAYLMVSEPFALQYPSLPDMASELESC